MMMTGSHCYCFFGIISIFFSLIIHTLSSTTPHSCLHHQREALLEFRDEFPIDEFDPNPWNKSSTDCCLWKGITCDDRSGQVISLNLVGTFLNGSFKTNSSLFRLQYLRHLNLSYCDIQGEIPSSLGNLSRLTVIDLSHNNLVGEIPVSIGNLKRLRHVELGANTLIGAIPSSLGKLNQLRYLSLAANELTGEIPSSLGNLSSLLELRLSINHLVGQVPDSIGKLNDLRVISLGQNTLNGAIPISFANLTKLYHISLRSNNFTSTLPSDMSVYHDLEHFDVAANSFLGSFPKSLFTIPSLQVVYLDDNQFIGPIEFVNTSSSSSPKLEILSLASNIFIGVVPESISKFLNLGEINLFGNNFSGHIPRSISKLVNLQTLNLASNNLEGQVPACLWRLTTVTLSNNFFSSFENPSQETLIQALDLNSNSFQGPFPHWICNTKGLSFLDLSNNLFNGSIPLCLEDSIASFSDLILRNNSFSGTLPDIFANAIELRSLDVSRNQLEGNLPKSLINCKALQLVNMESNRIKDVFPSWLGSLPSLHVLILRSNEFHGTLHHHDHVFVGFQSLRIIDISHNDFTGTLPPYCFSSWRGMTILREEDDPYMADIINESVFYRNSMVMVSKGVELSFERIQQDFRAIDISGNKIYGKIPESLSFLKELHLLNLSGNAFTSHIPRSLANLTKLETLDLSRNKLSGQIPQDLGELSSLSYMNFSSNLLKGPVPRGTQFQRQNCSSFSDNDRLFGLEEICGKIQVSPPTSQQPEKLSEPEEELFSWVAAAIAYGPGVFCGLVIGHIFTSYYHKIWSKKNTISCR
ncbi:receptor-like protein 12 [Brassica napus]|uniref:receptor-like protein 12 n=1 Tax=Brassica napus TaxID=3708 RepID=UPI002078583F|nr:receptor-like protein 12 [Brassica napus]